MERLAGEVSALRTEIAELKDTIKVLNCTLMDLIGTPQNIIETKYRPHATSTPPHNPTTLLKNFERFPIQTQVDLDCLEGHVNDVNKDGLVDQVRKLLGAGGLKKNITNVLAQPVILEYNLDGKHRKLRLRNYPNLMDILFRAAQKDNMSYLEFLDEMRQALKNAKNKYFKNLCVQRKKQRMQTQHSATEYVNVRDCLFMD